LNAATSIGDALADEAVWYGDRCSWIGAGIDSSPNAATVQAALGAELYAGTSGVAVFLAALATAADGRPAFGRTAVGAIKHGLSRMQSDERCASPSLYTGRVGILVAAAYAGRLLGAHDLVAEVRSAALGLATTGVFDEPSDLIAGRAGAIVGLLVLAAILGDRAHLDSAIRLGDELIERAEADPTGWSWPSATDPSRRALTGFAHGAAGVGAAFVELFAATEDSRYRHAALEAFRWERHRFDRVRGNWFDLRDAAAAGLDTVGKAPCALHWCHGAPGIALSRARAYEIVGDRTCLAEAETAASTTRRSLEDALTEGRANYSLCHGLGGNGDVVLTVLRCLGRADRDSELLAYSIAAAGIDRYLRTGFDWPCGGVGPSPGLMLGHAGIGYFYLRVQDRDLPSPLLVSLWAR
jgi:lantibiotic modifying enzyme